MQISKNKIKNFIFIFSSSLGAILKRKKKPSMHKQIYRLPYFVKINSILHF